MIFALVTFSVEKDVIFASTSCCMEFLAHPPKIFWSVQMLSRHPQPQGCSRAISYEHSINVSHILPKLIHYLFAAFTTFYFYIYFCVWVYVLQRVHFNVWVLFLTRAVNQIRHSNLAVLCTLLLWTVYHPHLK